MRRIFVIGLIAGSALIAGLTLYLSSTAGRTWLTARAEAYLSAAIGADVHVAHFAVRWPLALELAHFRLHDDERDILVVRDAYLRVSARKLLRRTVWIHEARIGAVIYNGWPTPPDEATDRGPDSVTPIRIPDLDRIASRVTIMNGSVDELTLGAPVRAESLGLSIAGSYTPVPRERGRTWHVDVTLLHRNGASIHSDDAPRITSHGTLRPARNAQWRVDSGLTVTRGRDWLSAWPESLPDHAQASFRVELDGDALVMVDHAALQTAMGTATTSGRIDLNDRTVSALTEVSMPALAVFSALCDTELAGPASARIEWDGALASPEVAVTLTSPAITIGAHSLTGLSLSATLRDSFDSAAVRLDVERAAYGTVGSGAFRVSADVADLRTQPHGTATLHIADVQTGDVSIHEAMLRVRGDLEHIELDLQADGTFLDAWSLKTQLTYARVGGGSDTVHLGGFVFDHGGFTVVLEQPVRARRTLGRLTVEEMVLRIGNGRLAAWGYMAPDQMEWSAQVTEVSLSTFGFAGVPDAYGAMGGTLRLHGHPSNPQAELALRVEDMLPANTNRWRGPPAQFSVHAALSDHRLATRFLLEGLTGEPVRLELEVPLHVSLNPLELTWPPHGDVSGRMQAETDLGELSTLFVWDVHRLEGMLAADLQLSGTVDEPDLSGHIDVRGGTYEHERLGTILRDIEVAFSGQRDRLSLDRFTATDGDGGRVTVRGAWRILPEADYPFDAEVELHSFRLMRNDVAHAIGRGKLLWAGNRHASMLTGQLTVAPQEWRIPERLPLALIDLDVIEHNGGGADHTPADDVFPHRLGLDVRITFPDRFFVRGRGLQSEWGGELRLSGSVEEPELSGALSVLRGRFLFFGKRLALSRGVITLDGSSPPVLDVVAESRSGGINAIMRLSGPLDAPAIELDSVPAMPEDEILARLLFGRASARITPWQAITIAQAVNRLRGGGSTFDVFGETRRLLQVDQFELREAEEGQMAVSVGKYVSDRIYVELERGVGAEGGRASVEVEITPTIRVETEVGANADSGLGFVWTWDY